MFMEKGDGEIGATGVPSRTLNTVPPSGAGETKSTAPRRYRSVKSLTL
jgi:hypothetical protein